MITLHAGDNRESLRAMIARGEMVDAAITDAPYGLISVAKRFGKKGAAPAKQGTDGVFARQSGGFMGKQWDATGIERDPEFWRLVWQVMKPGAYIVAFSSSRTYHRMATAIEDAGFITLPMIGWAFSQGFPKDSDAQRAIDVQLCELPGRHYEGTLPRDRREGDHICPKSDEGLAWEGYSYGGQALKPALEPIYVGQKPFSEKNGALNMLTHGVGGINIDGCRVPSEGELGRHPANLVHDGSSNVVALFPESKGQQGDLRSHAACRQSPNGIFGGMRPAVDHAARNDSGSAARFFNSFPHEGPIFHYPKATKKDRAGSKHGTVKPVALMRHLVRMHCPAGGTVLDPFAGSGTTGQACLEEGFDCILMEAEPEYVSDIIRRFDLPTKKNAARYDNEIMDLIGRPEIDLKSLIG